MAIVNVENSFLTENRSVLNFVNQVGQGFYIPLYQRDYSWDVDNIEQLIEDISRGIFRISEGEDVSKEIRFLGTIITVVESNKQNIYPVDMQAVPSKIEKIIDGQQRISTIAFIATLLTKRLIEIKKKPRNDSNIRADVEEICDSWINQKLKWLFSFDLGRGKPTLKPKIIRGAKDYWVRDDKIDEAYTSELSNYLAHFIQDFVNQNPLPGVPKGNNGTSSLLYQNGKKVESWLRDVAKAHENNSNEDFASAQNIIKYLDESLLWDFQRPNLIAVVENSIDFSDKRSDGYVACELVQTLSVCHYLLDRCCFTIIQPTDDDWAFDMFQSLNATGTPLTAIETFKPTVVNTVNHCENQMFKGSVSERYFKKIEDLLQETKSAQEKNKRTNDYLTSFYIALEGRTISNHFSSQRQVLDRSYNELQSIEEKESFIQKMGDYADFYKIWLNFKGTDGSKLSVAQQEIDEDLSSMLISFLKSSNHKMAITVLANTYYRIKKESFSQTNEFEMILKMVFAYYLLWRSALPNAGLDGTYREYFKELYKNNEEQNIENLRRHFISCLKKRDIDTKEKWMARASSYLKYGVTTNEVIKMSLLIAAHDTIADKENPGRIKIGRPGCSKYWAFDNWISVDLKTIEHIAPQSPQPNDNPWDPSLYEQDVETYQCIGNLTLLPQNYNTSASNKSWKEKLLYYKCLAEKDPQKLENIKAVAKEKNIVLNDNTISILQNASYNNHVESIIILNESDNWSKTLVENRTRDILNIIWDRISPWLLE